MKTVGEAAEWGPKGWRAESRGQRPTAGVGFLERAASPPPPSKGPETVLWAPPAGFERQPRPPKGIHYFQHSRLPLLTHQGQKNKQALLNITHINSTLKHLQWITFHIISNCNCIHILQLIKLIRLNLHPRYTILQDFRVKVGCYISARLRPTVEWMKNAKVSLPGTLIVSRFRLPIYPW